MHTVADIAVVLNARAGTGHTPPDAATLRAAFAARGLHAAVFDCKPGGDMAALLQQALASRPTLLVAAGGDGTVNAVAACALAHDLPFGVLPLGTLNHFARDLGLPQTLEQAIDVIAARTLHAVDVGEVNGEVFLNNASIGLYPMVVAQRVYEQRHFARGKWSAMLHAAWRVLRRPRAYEVALDLDGHTERRRTPSVFVGNNPYVLEGSRMGQRDRLDRGTLGVLILRERSAFGWLWLALRALCGRLSVTDVEQHVVRRFRLDATRPLPIARDGETATLAPPLHFRIRPRALQVCVAAEER